MEAEHDCDRILVLVLVLVLVRTVSAGGSKSACGRDGLALYRRRHGVYTHRVLEWAVLWSASLAGLPVDRVVRIHLKNWDLAAARRVLAGCMGR